MCRGQGTRNVTPNYIFYCSNESARLKNMGVHIFIVIERQMNEKCLIFCILFRALILSAQFLRDVQVKVVCGLTQKNGGTHVAPPKVEQCDTRSLFI